MSDSEHPQPDAFDKRIHEKATRKVPTLNKLIEQSRRPDRDLPDEPSIAPSEPATVDADSIDGVEVEDGGLFDDLFEDSD